jgi:hypothetical protein
MIDTRNALEYEPWKVALVQQFSKQAQMSDDEAWEMILNTGDECWREMWADGLSPFEAVYEEISNWDP